MGSDLYIGAPNGIMLCVDGIDTNGCRGRFYHSYSHQPTSFGSLGEMLFKMETFFDKLNFPHRGNSVRYFTDSGNVRIAHKEASKVMSDEKLLEHRGEQETFIIRVQHRQNNTWQGRITWADKNKTLNFRSIWEMVHLMEDALYEGIPSDEIPQIRSWED